MWACVSEWVTERVRQVRYVGNRRYMFCHGYIDFWINIYLNYEHFSPFFLSPSIYKNSYSSSQSQILITLM